MSCSKCNLELKSKKDSLTCTECKRQFHVNCARVVPAAGRPATRSGTATPWRCEECAAEVSSVNSRSDSEMEPVNVMDMLKIIRSEMAADRSNNSGNFENVNSNIKLVHDSLEDIKMKISSIEKDHITMKEDMVSLQARNAQLTRRLEDVEARMNAMEQYSRIGNLEIRGVPLSTGEDVLAIMEKLAEALGVDFGQGDISICHRLPAPRDARFHPAIVAQFTSRTTRARWLAAAKIKKLTTKDLAPNFRPGMVFISEHLTPHNKAVMGQARRLVRAGMLAYAWSKDGKLFVRKSPISSATRVWTVADVEGAAGVAGSTHSASTGAAGPDAARPS